MTDHTARTMDVSAVDAPTPIAAAVSSEADKHADTVQGARDSHPDVASTQAVAAALSPNVAAVATPSLHPDDVVPAAHAALDVHTDELVHTAAAATSSSTSGVVDHTVAASPSTAAAAPRRRGHRAQSTIWKLLTQEENAHKRVASVCMHCASAVPHHHKSEKARAHLKRCAGFRRFMASVVPDQRPEWFDGDLDRDARLRRLRAGETGAASDGSSSGAAVSQLHGQEYAQAPAPVLSAAAQQQLESALAASGRRRARPGSLTPTGSQNKRVKPATPPPDTSAVLDALSMYVYTSGVPLAHMEDPHLQRMLQLCLPQAILPTQEDARGSLLDRAYASLHSKIQHTLQQTPGTTCILANAWYPATKAEDSVVEYLVSNGSTTFQMERSRTLQAGDSDHVDQLTATMTSLMNWSGNLVGGAVTDNTPGNQLMWSRMKEQFPHRFFHGCASHGLHLFMNQIFSEFTATTNASDEADASVPFAELRVLAASCREVVAYFATGADAATKEELSRRLNVEALPPQLQFASPGHFEDYKAGFEGLAAAVNVLKEVISSVNASSPDEHDRFERVRAIITSEELMPRLSKAIAILRPLDTLSRRLASDSTVPISEVFYSFAKQLPIALRSIPGLSATEVAFLLDVNQTRFNAMYGDSHGIAYLLDPRYVGEGLSPEVRKSIEDLIYEVPVDVTGVGVNSEEVKLDIAQQLTEYVIEALHEKNGNTFRYAILLKSKKTVLQYWLTDGSRWPLLQRLATRVFSLPASTLPAMHLVRRCMLAQRGVPSDCKDPEAIRKIEFIQVNTKLLQAAGAMDASDRDSGLASML